MTAAISPSAPRARSSLVQSWRTQFVLLSAIWGSSFLCIKVLDDVWAPVQVALARVALGALFLVGALAVKRRPLPRDRAAWGHVAVIGAFMNALPFTLFAFGEQHVSSVIAGLWNGTTPLMTLVAVLVLLPDERPSQRRLGGVAGGFAGLVVLLGPWQGLGGDELLGHVACALGACCYGIGLTYTRRHVSARPESGLSLAAAQLLCATAMLAVVAPLAGAPSFALDGGEVAAVLVLGVLGSGLAYVLTHAIVRAAGPSTFSLVTYVIPIFSTILGVAILSESVSWNQPVGAAIVLAAIWSRPPAARPAGRARRLPWPRGRRHRIGSRQGHGGRASAAGRLVQARAPRPADDRRT
jgi:drug/metabolite transporter (DMT)-like permease